MLAWRWATSLHCLNIKLRLDYFTIDDSILCYGVGCTRLTYGQLPRSDHFCPVIFYCIHCFVAWYRNFSPWHFELLCTHFLVPGCLWSSVSGSMPISAANSFTICPPFLAVIPYFRPVNRFTAWPRLTGRTQGFCIPLHFVKLRWMSLGSGCWLRKLTSLLFRCFKRLTHSLVTSQYFALLSFSVGVSRLAYDLLFWAVLCYCLWKAKWCMEAWSIVLSACLVTSWARSFVGATWCVSRAWACCAASTTTWTVPWSHLCRPGNFVCRSACASKHPWQLDKVWVCFKLGWSCVQFSYENVAIYLHRASFGCHFLLKHSRIFSQPRSNLVSRDASWFAMPK